MQEMVIVAVCLVLNAILAGAEMAFVTIPKSQLRILSKGGDKRASKALELREHPERTLSVIQIGITLVGALGAAVGGAGAEESISPLLIEHLNLTESVAEILSIILVVIPISYLNVVIGELVPKSIALRNPTRLLLRNVGWLYWFDQSLSPVVTLLEKSTQIFMRFMPKKSKQSEAISPVESVELDSLSNQTRQYVVNLVHFEKKRVKDACLAQDQVDLLKQDDSLEDVENCIIKCGHTRLPVLDSSGKLIGVLNTKEFMALRLTGRTEWVSLIRPAVKVQESDSLTKALRIMQERRSHLSAVYQGDVLVGIVTIEDILEEVIGDLFDEDDDGKIQHLLSVNSRFRESR